MTNAINQYNVTATAAPRSTHSLLKEPKTFDGSDPNKLAAFLNQCYLIFADRPQDFPEDDDKIYYVRSRLRGTAQQWFEPNLYDQTPGPPPAWDGNFSAFIRELSLHFGPHDPIGDAEDNLKTCRMKHSDKISTYLVRFDSYAAITGWDDRALRSQFYDGLPSRIKDEMVHHSYVNNLNGVKLIAHRIDARYWQRETEKARERSRNSSSGTGTSNSSGQSSNSNSSGTQKSDKKSGKKKKQQQSSSASTSNSNNSGKSAETPKKPKPYASKLGSDGKLKPEEREQRKKNNLCMFCGGNHATPDCDKKPSSSASSSGSTQGKAATTSKTPAATSGDSTKAPEPKKE